MPTNATLLHTDSKQSGATTAGSSTASHLIPRTLYGTLFAALKRNLVLSSLAARRIGPESVPGSSIDIPSAETDSLTIKRVGEGAVVGLSAQNYTSFNVKPYKYGVRIMITREVEEDSLFDLMAMNIEEAGYQLAKNEEALIVATLDAGSTAASHNVANSNATLPVTDITAAIQNLRAANAEPTDMIIGAGIENDLYNIDTFTEADKSGTNNPSNRLIGRIAGMNVIVSNSVTATLAYVIDRRKAFIIVEKRPVTVERYFAAERDSSFAVVTQRIAARYLYADAISEITTT